MQIKKSDQQKSESKISIQELNSDMRTTNMGVIHYLSLTHSLKHPMIWSAAFSSISPGLVWPMDVRCASACGRDQGWRDREREGGRERGINRGLEKGRKMRVSERRNGGVKNRKRGERENGGKIERVGWWWVREEEKGKTGRERRGTKEDDIEKRIYLFIMRTHLKCEESQIKNHSL